MRKSLQAFFHWNYSGGIILFCLGAVMACVGIETFFSEDRFFFHWAYFFAACGLIWSLGYWLTSETLEGRHEVLHRRRHRGHPAPSRSSYELLKWSGCLLILCVFSGAVYFVYEAGMRKELQSNVGYLFPAHDPVTPDPCPGPGMRIILGSLSAKAESFPVTVLRMGGVPVLVMDRKPDGQIAISTDIYDQNHDIVAEIDNNHYDVHSSAFKIIRKDRSSLSVFIRRDKEEVLRIRYLNPESVSIMGAFRTLTDEVSVIPEGVQVSRSVDQWPWLPG